MENINLKLLLVFAEIYNTRSITQAAENLDLGQPAVSMSLSKLRKHYNDLLFVRTSEGMAATPHAQEIIQNIQDAIKLLNLTLQYRVVFDPLKSTRIFRFAMTDLGVRVIIPSLLEWLRHSAPSIKVHVSNLNESTPKYLETGEVDLAVGFLTQQGPGFFQQMLGKDRYVCLIWAGHPRIKDVLTMEQFQSERHVVVSLQGTGHRIIEQELEDMRISIVLKLSNFLEIPIIRNTEFLAVVPESYAKVLVQTGAFRAIPLPFEMLPYKVMLHWHERFLHDPAVTWIRGGMMELFREGPPRDFT